MWLDKKVSQRKQERVYCVQQIRRWGADHFTAYLANGASLLLSTFFQYYSGILAYVPEFCDKLRMSLRVIFLLMLLCLRPALPHPTGLQAPGNEITSPHRAWLRLNAPKCLHAWLLAFLLACHRTPRTHWNAEYSLFDKSHRWTRTHDTLTPWAPVRAKNCHDTWRSDLAGLRVSCLHLAALAAPSPGVTPPHLWSLEAPTVSR